MNQNDPFDQDPPEGGSYTRQPDGSLVRADAEPAPQAAPQEQPADTE